MLPKHETLCPSGLRGWTQVPLARAAWVQIPQVSYLIVWLCVSGVSSSKSPQPHRCVGYALANRSPARWPCLVFNCMDGWRELRTGWTAWACKNQQDCTKWQEDVNLFISTSGVAQWLACWAHNPKVPGSKPGSAICSCLKGFLDQGMVPKKRLACSRTHTSKHSEKRLKRRLIHFPDQFML